VADRNLPPEYTVEALASHHDRAGFNCGVPALDLYLQRQARQDMNRRLAAVFILTPDSKTIAGFYTLSASSMFATELPPDAAENLPRFPLPITLLGRMAISSSLQGQHLGDLILAHALRRALAGSAQVGSWAVAVDAKIGARDFYLKRGFLPLPLQPDRLVLPMTTITKLFGS